MNQVAHTFFTYSVLSFFILDIRQYIVAIAIFSSILDLDHIPGYIKYLSMERTARKKVTLVELVKLIRTPLQEPIGIIMLELILLSLFLLGIRDIIMVIAAASFVLHWFLDFLTVHTNPLSPISDNYTSIFFSDRKMRVISEIVLTILFGVIFYLRY